MLYRTDDQTERKRHTKRREEEAESRPFRILFVIERVNACTRATRTHESIPGSERTLRRAQSLHSPTVLASKNLQR